MARSLVFTFLLSTIAAGCSARPPARSFTDLQQRIRPGHTLYVIDAAGTETRGKLTAFTPSGLTLVDVSGIRGHLTNRRSDRCSATAIRCGTAS